MELLSKRLFVKSEGQGGLLCCPFYGKNEGRIVNYVTQIKRSDTFSDSIIQLSDDNLKTFSKEYTDKTSWQTDKGTMTKYFKVQVIDKLRNNLYMFYNQGLLPSNDPKEGVKNWQMYYAMSKDGGETFSFYEPIILEGDEYNITHPINDVFIGHNSFMVGDYPCVPIILPDGETILLAVQVSVLNENMELFNPYGSFTFQASYILKGKFQEDGHIKWESMSNKMLASIDESTRGTIEPAICRLPDGRILMVNRGSNDLSENIPSYRWYCISKDDGDTLKGPYHLTYSSGEKFFSPSSCSMLLPHTNGKIYWIGNISPKNARGNMPRNPLCIVEVEHQTIGLKKETKFDVIKRDEKDYHDITFSNFYAREEKATGDILIYCTSFWSNPDNPMESEGSYEYRIKV